MRKEVLHKGVLILLATLSLVLPSTSATAAETSPLAITTATDNYDITPHLATLEDASGTLTIDDAQKAAIAGTFTPATAKSLSFGWSDSAWWLRLRLANDSGKPQQMVLYLANAWIDYVDLYLPGNGGYRKLESGEAVPPERRPMEHHNAAFAIPLEAGEAKTVFLRVQCPQQDMHLPFRLFTEKAFADFERNIFAFYALFLGVMAVMVLYNLLLYSGLKDRIYLYYVVYVALTSLAMLAVKGYTRDYLLAGADLWLINRAFPLFSMLGYASGIHFTRTFLATAETAPAYDKALRALFYFTVSVAAITFFPPSFPLVQRLVVFVPLAYTGLLILSGFQSLRQGNRAARFFLASWLFTLVGITVYVLSAALGILPYNVASDNAVETGLLFEVVLLSMALADKVNIIRTEKEAAQTKALEQESLMKQVLSRANVELERKVAERTEELQNARIAAEQATMLKDKFISLVSHDLRSPLTAIIGALDLMGGGNQPWDESAKKNVYAKVLNNAKALLHLIDQLLDIGRLRSGRIRLLKKNVEVRHLATKIIERAASAAEQKGVRIENAVPASMRLLADPALYGEVIHNLVSNAIKFTKKGDAITIEARPEKPNTISVRDTGLGIPPALIPDLFKAEVKTSTTGTAGEKGTGLGLPYCWEIIAAHGGGITVESALGKGTVFHVSLRRYEVVVLIVDDHEPHRNMMKEIILGSIAAEFMEAENGQEALEISRWITPHIIITDLNMPVMGGFDLIRAARVIPALRSIPILAVTSGESSRTTVAEAKKGALAAGADEFMLKPVVASEFLPLVRRLLG